MPAAAPRLSVTIHEIVCTPLASVVLSNTATPSAFGIPGKSLAGNSPVKSDRDDHPEGTWAMNAPSITTRTVPPPGGSARAGFLDSTHPKLSTLLPLTVPPCAGVSIAPKGAVAVALVHVMV